MGEKLIVGPITKGLKTNPLAFYIDNDAFPYLFNAYAWRGRAKRKRGTSLIGRLQRKLGTTSGTGALTVTISPVPITGLFIGQVTIGTDIFTDPGTASPVTLLTNSAGTAILNRTTGVLTITGSIINTVVNYTPNLPVMGLEDLNLTASQFPGTLGFDTTYSYNISPSSPYTIKDVSFYKNPILDAVNLPGYVTRKASATPLIWNGQDYQQFWTTNYENALWATNGIAVPFDSTKLSMQFSHVTNVGAPAGQTVAITVTGANLIVGDFVFLNEFDPAVITGVNFQSGYVTAGSAPGVITVTLPFATLGGAGGATTKGIVQYLTNNSDSTKDCIRWYDGDPTVNVAEKGWVNFCPPLSNASFGIADEMANQYYLIGARVILPFKDRIIFFGPVIQTSGGATGAGTPLYLQDTIIYSQNGTPYYTASFTGNVASTGFVFHPICTPTNQTATANAYFEDVTGYGGFLTAGYAQAITTASPNEDALIVGFTSRQTRLIYSGNDIVPFNFYVINSEMGTSSTFSVINLDRGVQSIGDHGIIQTSQISSERIDLDIPDQVFQFNLENNGTERITAQRDFISEWIYFSFSANNEENTSSFKFPNQTLFYNYREGTWGIFGESYTTYGQFRKVSGDTWTTLGLTNLTWATWNSPWNSGASTLLQPKVICGNTQGFVIEREEDTDEATSLAIQNFSGNTVTSPNHMLGEGDYITISGALGTIGAQVNGKTFSVVAPTQNTFQLDPIIGAGTYFGSGLITRIPIPFIQTKQFPSSWAMGRKTRLGVQQYLLTKTTQSQIQLLIFLSQNADQPFNTGSIVPPTGPKNPLNSALIYSTVLYTCPESTNLGLSPPNTNLQMPTASSQEQIWHRMNTSLIGDTVQLGFTMSDTQIRAYMATGATATITGVTQAYPAVVTAVNTFSIGELVQITGVLGMTQLNYNSVTNNTYQIVAASPTSFSINVDSTLFTAYSSGGLATQVTNPNQFAEIELHGFCIDCMPSSLLA